MVMLGRWEEEEGIEGNEKQANNKRLNLENSKSWKKGKNKKNI